MTTVFFSRARAELARLLDKVTEDAAPIEIVRRDKPSAVLISRQEYDGLMETVHLLSSPANAERLLRGDAQIASGTLHRIDPADIG